jgi:hypothetical protein
LPDAPIAFDPRTSLHHRRDGVPEVYQRSGGQLDVDRAGCPTLTRRR